MGRWFRLVAVAVVAMLLAVGCTQRNAVLDNYDESAAPQVLGSADPADAVDSDTSDLASTDAGQASTTTPSPEPAAEPARAFETSDTADETNGAEDDPFASPEKPEAAAREIRTDDSIAPLPLDGRGGELGCSDATDLRLRFSQSVVAEQAEQMPVRLWLCEATPIVTAELDCFAMETTELIDAIEREMADTGGERIADELRSTNALFCADPTVVDLGTEDIERRIEEEIEGDIDN